MADGGTGSMVARSLAHEAPPAVARGLLEVNLTQPELVHAIHLGYIAAGARIITTNSFGASRARLERIGLGEQAKQIVSQSVKIAREAREAAGSSVWIAGAISPLDADWLLDSNPSAPLQIVQFQAQVDTLLDRGVDFLVLETFSNLDHLCIAIDAVRRMSATVPLLVSMSFDQRGELASGETAELAGRQICESHRVDGIGVNCSLGPQASLSVLDRLRVGTSLPLTIRPNAGFAQRLGGRVLYPNMSRDYYESFTRDALRLGAHLVGGCCGTTPEQIRVMGEVVETVKRQPESASKPTNLPRFELSEEDLPARASERPSTLTAKLRAGEFVRSLQLDPQRGPSDALNREAAQAILESGTVDLVDINTSATAGRQDSLQVAAGIERLGLETLAHISPRDSSVSGVLAQVLGAYDWGGVRNVLVIVGDPPKGGFYAESKGVYHVDSIGLVRALDRLRAGRRVNNKVTVPPFELGIGVALNQNAPDVEAELIRLQQKIDAGADFAMTQPFFDIDDWYRFRHRVQGRVRIPVILGAWPLISLKQARRINENVSGVFIPESVCRKLGDAGAEEREVGFQLAAEFIRELEYSRSAAGVYVVAPFKQPKLALSVFERAYETPATDAQHHPLERNAVAP